MKALRENIIMILGLLLLGLIFILWARIMASQIHKNSYQKGLTTLSARLECVRSFGWEVDTGSETKEKTRIPEESDSVFDEYNRIQLMCGFDLRPYCQKTVFRYTYKILNFPYAVGGDVFVNILVYEDEMIGGDCSTRALDGFIMPISHKK